MAAGRGGRDFEQTGDIDDIEMMSSVLSHSEQRERAETYLTDGSKGQERDDRGFETKKGHGRSKGHNKNNQMIGLALCVAGLALISVCVLYFVAGHVLGISANNGSGASGGAGSPSATPSFAPTTLDWCAVHDPDCGSGASCVDSTIAGVSYTCVCDSGYGGADVEDAAATCTELTCDHYSFAEGVEGGDEDGCNQRTNFTLSAVTDTNCTLQCKSGYTHGDSVTSTLECPRDGGTVTGGMSACTAITVSFSSSVILTSVTTADLDSDFEDDFANATEAEMNDGFDDDEKVEVNNITVSDTTVSSRRVLLSETSAIKVSFDMHKKCGSRDSDIAFGSVTTDLKQLVKNGTLVAKVKQVADTLPSAVDLEVASFVKPTVYKASGCSGRYSDSTEANHFTSYCNAATASGDICDVTAVAGYEGGSLTCESNGLYSAVPATPIPTALPSPVPSALPQPSPTPSPTGSPTPKPTFSPNPSALPVPAPSVQPSAMPTAMPVPASINRTVIISTVPLSALMELLTLSWISNDSAIDSVVARSYGGYDWEYTRGLMLPGQLCHQRYHLHHGNDNCAIECEASGNCTVVFLPQNDYGSVYLTRHNISALAANATAARFLHQVSYGPTVDTIVNLTARLLSDGFNSMDSSPDVFEDFLEEQMAVPPTSHRAYLRQRMNQRVSFGAKYITGQARTACDYGSRWHRFAFTSQDLYREISVEALSDAKFGLVVDGVTRTEVNQTFYNEIAGGSKNYICDVDESIGGELVLGNANCENENTTRNPPIEFYSVERIDPNMTIMVMRGENKAARTPQLLELDSIDSDDAFILNNRLHCTAAEKNQAFLYINGTMYRHDARINQITNTIENPANLSASALSALSEDSCPSVPKTFLNKETCVRRQSCAPIQYTSVDFVLDQSVLRKWYELSNKIVYYVTGLKLTGDYEMSPCDSGDSRWLIHDTACGRNATNFTVAATKATIIRMIKAAGDASNPYVIDVDVTGDGGTCTDTNSDTIGAMVTIGGKCYQNVHPDEYNVYDFSSWTTSHEGNDPDENFYPISQNFAMSGTKTIAEKVHMTFPSSHSMNRWDTGIDYLTYIGIYGETVNFGELDTSVQSVAMAEYIGADGELGESTYEVCGSPNEVQSDPHMGSRYIQWLESGSVFRYNDGLDQSYRFTEAKQMVHNSIALKVPDQLRQRMAWALAQIYVLGEEGAGGQTNHIEWWTNYYDIFVRHAFGNLRDIIKEVSYSPAMGAYLTFKDSQSFAKSGSAADENYARELMQLFSIGLWELELDGTPELSDDGTPISTYDNSIITDFARVWTGFGAQSFRGNVEAIDGDSSTNYIDPMQITSTKRDLWPKMNLYDGYLGDGLPLCQSLPSHAFLRRGATYNYLGTSSTPVDHAHSSWWDSFSDNEQFVLDPRFSDLWVELCAAHKNADYDTTATDGCTFPSEVVLDRNLQCHSDECQINAPRVVHVTFGNVQDGTNGTVYYEYRQIPCTVMQFFPNAKTLSYRPWKTNGQQTNMCGNPLVTAGAAVCCGVYPSSPQKCIGQCLFLEERVTYSTAEERCEEAPYLSNEYDQSICESFRGGMDEQSSCGYSTTFGWTSTSCTLMLQVWSDGTVNTVHSPDGNDNETDWGLAHGSTYRVRWDDGLYPHASNECDGSGMLCEVYGDSCLCEVEVKTEPVYQNWSVPTVTQILSDLTIGSVSPNTYDNGVYEVRNITTNSPTPGPTALDSYDPLFMLGTKGMCVRERSGEIKLDLCWTYTKGHYFSPVPTSEESAGPVWDEDGLFLCTSGNPGTPTIGDKLTLNETCTSGHWWMNSTTGALVHSDTQLCVNAINLKDEFPTSYEEDLVLNTSCAWEVHQYTEWNKPPGWGDNGFAVDGSVSLQTVENNANHDPPRWQMKLEKPCVQNRVFPSDKDGTMYNISIVNGTGHRFPHRLYYMKHIGWPSGDEDCYMYIYPYAPEMANFTQVGSSRDWPEWEDEFDEFAANTRLYLKPWADCNTDDDSLQHHEGCTVAPTTSPTPPTEFYSERSSLGVPDGVTVWTKNTTHGLRLDMDTIFEIPPQPLYGADVNTSNAANYTVNATTSRYWRNMRSTVHIGNFSFRNPVQFNDVVEPNVRDAEYETEALIDHVFWHKNTAPFISYRLIQRFVSSNPSPRYVRAVSEAFRTGTYKNRMYSGSYGDLGAAIAAVLLDREARSGLLDHDPTHGTIREPILKLLGLMRSLSFVPTGGVANREVELWDLQEDIGQQAYNMPSVFNFYNWDYSPNGVALESGLYAPEAGLANGPYLIGFLNGVRSLVRWGLSSCYDGFGGFEYKDCSPVADVKDPAKNMQGDITWVPESNYSDVSGVLDELELLLVPSAHLNERNREIIQNAYASQLKEGDTRLALATALQLLATTADFSTSTANIHRSGEREPVAKPDFLDRDYKAIVYLYFNGGLDSFNILIPHSGCNGTGATHVRDQYETIRGGVALDRDEVHEIDAGNPNQPCKTFGIHGELEVIKDLYDDGDAIFLANIGALVEPLTLDEWDEGSKQLPQGLFAHNTQTVLAQTVHAGSAGAKGMLGRIVDSISGTSYRCARSSGSARARARARARVQVRV
mmetsp:Transcript_102655/g.294143  ORF Transcript_102655/g.294143 Transcript_102655/m.294143 type:complete len:2583 (-) Transcript_102655:1307-9055(-)